jgi:peptidoglycan/LPS O-acetylase OafA/YrhL
VLSRAPRLVLVLTGAMYLLVVADFVRQLPLTATWVFARGTVGPFPLIGALSIQSMLVLCMMFFVGACGHLYRDRVPMHPAIAAGAAVAFVGSAAVGGFLVIGLPAYAYLLLWAACRLPRRLQGVGRRRDYSYGIYIYAYPVQQMIAMLGGTRWGVPAYIAMSLAGTLLLAVPSWHLVEKPVMSLKNWTPRLPCRWRPTQLVDGPGDPPAGPVPAGEPTRAPAADRTEAGSQ